MNRVCFRKFAPFDFETGGFQLLNLSANRVKRDDGIKRAVSDEQALFTRDGRKFFQQVFNLKNPAADADKSGEPMRITQTGVNRHQAALRKSAERDLLRRKIFRAQAVEQIEKHFAAAQNSRRGGI